MRRTSLTRKSALLAAAATSFALVSATPAFAQDAAPFNAQTGTSASPGRFIAPQAVVSGTDSGKSWSARS